MSLQESQEATCTSCKGSRVDASYGKTHRDFRHAISTSAHTNYEPSSGSMCLDLTAVRED